MYLFNSAYPGSKIEKVEINFSQGLSQKVVLTNCKYLTLCMQGSTFVISVGNLCKQLRSLAGYGLPPPGGIL